MFYDQRVPELGKRLLSPAERAIEQILLFPEAAPVVGITVRQKTLDRFPYSIFYLLEMDSVFILAFAHQKREPMYWKDRLR